MRLWGLTPYGLDARTRIHSRGRSTGAHYCRQARSARPLLSHSCPRHTAPGHPVAGFRRNAAWPNYVHRISPKNVRAVVKVMLHRRPPHATAVEYANAAESSRVDVRHFFVVRAEPYRSSSSAYFAIIFVIVYRVDSIEKFKLDKSCRFGDVRMDESGRIPTI